MEGLDLMSGSLPPSTNKQKEKVCHVVGTVAKHEDASTIRFTLLTSRDPGAYSQNIQSVSFTGVMECFSKYFGATIQRTRNVGVGRVVGIAIRSLRRHPFRPVSHLTTVDLTERILCAFDTRPRPCSWMMGPAACSDLVRPFASPITLGDRPLGQ
jgi:hypothetical protein